MAGVNRKRRPASRVARADPESVRRSKRQREEARAAKPLVPVPVLSTSTLAVEETMDQTLARDLRYLNRKVFFPAVEKPRPPPVDTKRSLVTICPVLSHLRIIEKNLEQKAVSYGSNELWLLTYIILLLSWEQLTYYDTSSQTPAACPEGTVEHALEHYNRLPEQDEHELVRAVDSSSFYFNGLWVHVNFLARLKGGTTCVELVPKYFFAELRFDPNHKGFSCVSCVKMDPDDPETAPVRGCGICPSQIFHPAAGGHRGLDTPHQADGGIIKKGKPAPQTAKSLFDSWIRKIQE